MQRFMLMPLSTVILFSALFLAFAVTPTAAQSFPSSDMITAQSQPDQCLTVSEPITAAANLVMRDCRGTNNQYWERDSEASQWRTALDPTYCLATIDATPYGGAGLTVRPCNDNRALTLFANTTLSDSYRISDPTFVLDWGVYGHVALAYQNGWDYQKWGWMQPALDVVNSEGCAIPYPFSADDLATYAREIACDRVAKLQLPFVIPAAAKRDPTVFPGIVPSDTVTVTYTYQFDLHWKDQDYLRIATPTQNWLSTGLWAPADRQIRVTVSGADASDVAQVWLRIGEHTDLLSPTSDNVKGGTFDRYPAVTIRSKLVVGENWVRSPYGGSIVLESDQAIDKVITVEIAGAVQMPYLKVGETSEAEWLAVRSSPVPYAQLESEIAVIHVPSSEVSGLSFVDALNTANYYSQVGHLHNELSGLSASDVITHQPPLGKYRHVEDIQISAGWGHSGFPMMYYNEWHIGIPEESVYKSSNWGVWHELGHDYQMGAWSYEFGTEVTVNLWSLFAQERLFGNSRLIDEDRYASAIAILNDPAVINKWQAADQLVFLDQIRLGFPNLNWDLWTQLIRRYREMTWDEYNALDSEQLQRDKFLEILCEITQTDLAPHFEAWTITISPSAKDYCASKAPLTQEIWLIDGAKPLYYAGAGNGEFVRELWSDLSGTALVSLTSSTNYPSIPTSTSILSGSLEGIRDSASNYGERLRGYIHAPVSGEYRFWLSADDSAQFLLSSDQDPIHATPLITLENSSGYRNFDSFVVDVQRSISVTLEAGQRYYFEVLHKEANGADSVSVAWTIPASKQFPFEPRKIIEGRYLSAYHGDLALQNRLAAGQANPILAGSDATFVIEVFNQGTSSVKEVQVLDTLPEGFALSPQDSNGWQSGYRYVRFQALSEAGTRGEWTSMAELGLLDQAGQPLGKNGWRVVSADSAQGDSPANAAIDNDPNSIWHTQWWPTVAGLPHEIQVDLGALVNPSGFTYLPRPNGGNGTVGDYRFAVSLDGSHWITVATGTFADDALTKTVSFTLPAPNQYTLLIPDTLAPGASALVSITLRSALTTELGVYQNFAEIAGALDGVDSLIYDSDSHYDSDSQNDLVIDNVLNNASGDEDDSDIAQIQLVSEIPAESDSVYLPLVKR